MSLQNLYPDQQQIGFYCRDSGDAETNAILINNVIMGTLEPDERARVLLYLIGRHGNDGFDV